MEWWVRKVEFTNMKVSYLDRSCSKFRRRGYNRRIISLGQSSRPYKNTSTPYIASFSALPFPHRSMLTTKLSWAKPNIVPQYTTLSGGGGRGRVGGRKTAVSKTTSQTIHLMHHCPNELVHDCSVLETSKFFVEMQRTLITLWSSSKDL